MLRLGSLLSNSRFYILVSSLLLSVSVISYLRIQIPSDQLFYIRSQQVFGLLAIVYLYVALIISPIDFIIGKHRMRYFEFARRAISVSAFYFALLHGAISLWGQLGGFGQLQYLPELFKWSLGAGLITFSILLVMAATSLDKVVSFMTYRRWKWLHRLVYIATILVVLHIWTIGTHIAYSNVRFIGFIALAVLFGLELFKTTKLLNKNHLHLDTAEEITLFVSLWIVACFALIFMPTYVQNYHSRHTNHSPQIQTNGQAE